MKVLTKPRNRRLVITDLDGTLLQTNRKFSPTDIATLEELGRNHTLRLIATGRSLYSAKDVIPPDFPIDYLIFSSGAGIVDWASQRILISYHLSEDEISTAIELLVAHHLDFMVHKPIPDNHYFWYHRQNHENPDFLRRYRRYQAFASPLTVPNFTVKKACQLLAIDPRQGPHSHYEHIKHRLPMLKVIRSTSPLDGASTWIEIFPKSVSKSLAGLWLARKYAIPQTDVLALGNDYNDLDLLDWAGTSFVVSNAPVELQRRYKTVKSNNNNGFTDAVNTWVQGEHL